MGCLERGGRRGCEKAEEGGFLSTLFCFFSPLNPSEQELSSISDSASPQARVRRKHRRKTRKRSTKRGGGRHEVEEAM
jgi:hypothetical protein